MSQSLAWIVLAAAGILEIGWIVALRAAAGFTKPLPVVTALALMAGSVGLLGLAMKALPLAVAYAIWTGIGVIGAALAGAALFGEALGPQKIAAIGLIVAGIAGLKLSV
ncbi:MAG: QacE family quaternary ammonium compound efflux SMR transporter [Salinarimonadaceae bacterium]|nr:MAG: QacE family quaternary ammonium compound efflux SMR transporter [Salinarimonadaceae bacterium]